MEKSGGQRTNNTLRDIALVPTGRQHPTHPNSKLLALIYLHQRKTLDRARKQNCRETTSALQPQKHINNGQGAINLAQTGPHK